MCDDECGCTSRQQNAHITETRIVLYPWHPWHGRSVLIVSAVTKNEHAVYRCSLEHVDFSRALEVPQWMFDAATCCRIRLSSTPAVSYQALRELRGLLDHARWPSAQAVLQAKHLSSLDPGGACATTESSARVRSAGIVSSVADGTAVDGLAKRSEATDDGAAGATAASPSARPSSARVGARGVR